MTATRTTVESIARRAASLWDRLNGEPRVSRAETGAAERDRRLARWRQVVAAGDHAAFERRLAWDGWTPAEVEHALMDDACDSTPPALPAWAAVLEDVVADFARCRDASASDELLDPHRPHPFHHVFVPLVLVARRRLANRLNEVDAGQAHSAGPVLLDSAQRGLERGLYARLERLGALALQQEFTKTRPAGINLLQSLVGATGGRETRRYDAFTTRLLDGALLPLFDRYPVLARHVATTIEQWVTACAEFVVRLRHDHADLARVFGDAAQGPLGAAVATGFGLSDAHRAGRCVIGVEFANGLTLAYKPKSLGLDAAFASLVRWCNEHGLATPLKPLRILDRGEYGWMEWADVRPCESDDAAGRFVARTGALLALQYVLRGTDGHNENLVAHGEHPVLIDLETLMEPGPPSAYGTSTEPDEAFWQSVIRTGLLPRPQLRPNANEAYDFSALGAIEAQPSPASVPVWTHVNTDDMAVEFAPHTQPPLGNVAFVGGAAVSPAARIEDLLRGFEDAYRLLARERHALLDADGPLSAFRGQPARYVFRPTEHYARLQRHLSQPRLLEDGRDRSIELDRVHAGIGTDVTRPPAWPLYHAELDALERLDIPRLDAVTDDTSVFCDGRMLVPHYFSRSGFDIVAERVAALCEEDLSLQSRIIRGTFAATRTRPVPPLSGTLSNPTTRGASANANVGSPVGEQPVAAMSDSAPSPDVAGADGGSRRTRGLKPARYAVTAPPAQVGAGVGAMLLARARALADDLEATALHDHDGSANWLVVGALGASETCRLEPARVGLYGGRAGIALFLAACDRVARADEHRDTASRAMRLLLSAVQHRDTGRPRALVRNLGLGIADGAGGLIYALCRLGEWWGDESLLNAAERLAAAVSEELVAADRELDVIGGAAGAILGLLALHETRPSAGVRATIDACARRLCATQHRSGPYAGGWDSTIASRPLTGFAHGASGIAFALARAQALIQEPRLRDAIGAALAFERTAFVPHLGNWIDYRHEAPENTGVCATHWCHGAPGIALARLAVAPHVEDPACLDELDIAITTTVRAPEPALEHLCCGLFGRIDLLSFVAARLDRTELSQEASRLAQARLALGAAPNVTPESVPAFQNPGLFDGTAGVGYALLRLAAPGRLPCVLALE